jgi:hypothetical protein
LVLKHLENIEALFLSPDIPFIDSFDDCDSMGGVNGAFSNFEHAIGTSEQCPRSLAYFLAQVNEKVLRASGVSEVVSS